jgi:MICOS complex subunit MIC60
MCTQAAKSEPKNPEVKEEIPPPPPPPPRKGGFLWKFLSLTIVGAGGTIGYAWYDADFRKNLENYVPYSKEALNYVFEYLPPNQPTKSVEVAKPSTVPEVKTLKVPVPPVKEEKTPVALPIVDDAKTAKQRKKKEEEDKKRLEQEKAKLALQRREDEEAAQNKELEFILDRLLTESKKSVEGAASAQKLAATAIKEHSKKLKQAMESASTETEWNAVVDTNQSRADAVWTSDSAAEKAKLHLEKLRSTITDGKADKVTKKNKVLLAAEEELNKLNYSFRSATNELSKAQSEAKVLAEYRDLVKKGRERFKKELESILPDVKSGERISGGQLTETELNSLIAHAHRRIDQLQKLLAEQQVMEQQRIEKSLDRQKEEDGTLAEEMLSRERDRWAAELEILKQKWDSEARIQFEIDLRAQLSRQAAAHSDHIVEVLKVQERELEAKFQLKLSEHIQKEKEAFQQQVAGWVARLHGIEAALDSRAEMEKQGRKAQELWLACQTLQNVVDKGQDAATWEEQLKALKPEVSAIREACISNPMIVTILEAIPDAAISRGVWTETALAERFEKVNKICRRVALIDETGGSLFKFFVSYLQSFFVFRSSRVFSESEEINPSGLSTFALLDNARHSLEHNDLEQAVRYINQLRGEPRRVAADWLLEARLRLETKQASEVLLAYASAVGLGSLF